MAQLVGLSSVKDDVDDECALQWAAIERLPTFERLRSSLFDENDGSNVDAQGKRVVDVTKLGALERNMFIDKLIKHIENDNLRLLHKLRKRIDKNLHLGRFSTPASNVRDCAKLPGLKSQEAKITIIDDVSGIIKPGRIRILGLDICAYTLIGDAMRRGISGGQKKRLTTGSLSDFLFLIWPMYSLTA
ncbi:hypothetical protein HYC85_001968 [Camellia sinensis]|uniref:Uncharacterized protein n=1 Tax=Camellia sinensis TaxID=4442 RepID=A0A7J7I757_CAMSI|nr:hypothetical protein HYC85_001968 [Camellia sinensis]